MNMIIKVVVATILLACIYAAQKDRGEQKARHRLGKPAPDERNWQQAFMRDVKNGYPRH